MRYLSIREILELHEIIIETSGGALGIRDIRALESSISQLRLTFNQADLYPDVITKAAALCFFLARLKTRKKDKVTFLNPWNGDPFTTMTSPC